MKTDLCDSCGERSLPPIPRPSPLMEHAESMHGWTPFKIHFVCAICREQLWAAARGETHTETKLAIHMCVRILRAVKAYPEKGRRATLIENGIPHIYLGGARVVLATKIVARVRQIRRGMTDDDAMFEELEKDGFDLVDHAIAIAREGAL